MPKRPPTRWVEHCADHVRRSKPGIPDRGAKSVCGALWYRKMTPATRAVAARKHEGSGRGGRCHECGRQLDAYGVCDRCVRDTSRQAVTVDPAGRVARNPAYQGRTERRAGRKQRKRCPTCGRPHKYHSRCSR